VSSQKSGRSRWSNPSARTNDIPGAKLLARIEKLGPKQAVEKYLAPFLAAGIKEMRPAIPAPLRFLLGPAVRQGLGPQKPEHARMRWLLWQLLEIHLQFALMVAVVILAAFAA
jgi:hypothetical protein